jgi:peptidoglycan DL-endopeptidase LytF
MSRRDIIIIAVLINAGLLVVLFTSALKSDNNDNTIAVQAEQVTPMKGQDSMVPSVPVRGDEVDQVLSQFASVPQSQETAALATPMVQPVAVAPAIQTPTDEAAPVSSFLEEAQGFNRGPSITPATPSASSNANPAAGAAAVSYKEIKVKKGDALEKIARANRTTVQEIMRYNQLSSTQLKIGQVLKIPSKKNQSPSSKSNKQDFVEVHYYVVKNGDNPWTIAIKNQMKVEELLQLNGLDEEKARKLKPGDQLRIR